MSKIIKMSAEFIEAALIDIKAALEKTKMSDGKFSFSKDFGNIEKRASLTMTTEAYAKMISLVHGCDSEVAWHGLVQRGEGENEYVIYDILVYPQEVTGATVTTDQEKYQDWLMEHDDETFNNIRMQGHSHVNMGVTPSSVDTALYDRILEQLDDSMFYIFMIWNKKSDRTIKIYDLRENVMFETKDVDFRIEGLSEWYEDAMNNLSKKTYQTTQTAGKNTPKVWENKVKESPKSQKQQSYGGYKYDGFDWDEYYKNYKCGD